MSPALASLVALLAAIVVSFVSRLNVGIVAIPLAWGIGAYAGRAPDTVLAAFPGPLFVTLTGVTLLFSLAESNGTIAGLAARLASVANGRARLLPLLIFLAACAISTAGPGAIPAVALMAPLAFAMAPVAAIPPFLTALMVANGANAGNLSPLSAVGIIANTRMAEAGVGGHEWKVWAANFLVHVLVSVVAWAVLVRRIAPDGGSSAPGRAAMTRQQWLTTAVLSSWVVAVVALGAPLAQAALTAAVLLIVVRLADESAAISRMPWGAILMVCGVAMLVSTAERVGGLELFTRLLAALATPSTLNGVIAFVTGAISSASSTSGVVLPTFLPTAPGLVQQVGGGDPLAVALSINVGSSLVDVSPLSTIGAICVAALGGHPGLARDLFRTMLIWGLSMIVVGALLCQLFAGWFAAI